MKYLLLLLFFYSSFLSAQEPLVKHEIFSIPSKILNEERIIYVQLPKNYHTANFSKGSYPVIYVLDGENNFPLVATTERYGTKFLYRNFPEMIVVGIRNTDRTRDYTPTKPKVDTNLHNKSYEQGGGADAFLSFINEELKPFVKNKFRTNGFDILHGHSFGGLFAIHTLVNHNNSFDAYIAIDPSLWWDEKVVYNQAQNVFSKNNFKGKAVFVALAYEAEENAKDRLQHGTTIQSFCEKLLPLTSQRNLNHSWKYYPDYDHGTVPLPSTFDGLAAIFNGIQLPVKEIPKKPYLLKEQFEKLSERMQFKIVPEESLFIELVKYARKVKENENALYILNYGLECYPESVKLKSMIDLKT